MTQAELKAQLPKTQEDAGQARYDAGHAWAMQENLHWMADETLVNLRAWRDRNFPDEGFVDGVNLRELCEILNRLNERELAQDIDDPDDPTPTELLEDLFHGYVDGLVERCEEAIAD